MNTEEAREIVRGMPYSGGIDFSLEQILNHSSIVAPSLAQFSDDYHFTDDKDLALAEFEKMHVAHIWLHAYMSTLDEESIEMWALSIAHMALETYVVLFSEHIRELTDPAPMSMLDFLLQMVPQEQHASFEKIFGALVEDLLDETPLIAGEPVDPEPQKPFSEDYYNSYANDEESAAYESWLAEHSEWEDRQRERNEATSGTVARVLLGETLKETRVDELEVGDMVQIGGARILIESIDPYDMDLVINKDVGLGVFGPRAKLLKVVEL